MNKRASDLPSKILLDLMSQHFRRLTMALLEQKNRRDDLESDSKGIWMILRKQTPSKILTS
jgi:hypothetical protein